MSEISHLRLVPDLFATIFTTVSPPTVYLASTTVEGGPGECCLASFFGNPAIRFSSDPWLCVPASRRVCLCREKLATVTTKYHARAGTCLHCSRTIPTS